MKAILLALVATAIQTTFSKAISNERRRLSVNEGSSTIHTDRILSDNRELIEVTSSLSLSMPTTAVDVGTSMSLFLSMPNMAAEVGTTLSFSLSMPVTAVDAMSMPLSPLSLSIPTTAADVGMSLSLSFPEFENMIAAKSSKSPTAGGGTIGAKSAKKSAKSAKIVSNNLLDTSSAISGGEQFKNNWSSKMVITMAAAVTVGLW